MRLRSENTRAAALFGAAIVLGVATGSATAEPVKIRLGTGSAVEEQLWLILVKPDIAPNYGKAYTLEPNKFRSSSKRVQAFEAGALDAISGHGALDMADGCFIAIRPTGSIHSYGPGARMIDLIRDPLNSGAHRIDLRGS